MMSAGRGRGGPATFRPPKPGERAPVVAAPPPVPLSAKPVIAALRPESDDESADIGIPVSTSSSKGTGVIGNGAPSPALRLAGVIIHVGSDYGILVDGRFCEVFSIDASALASHLTPGCHCSLIMIVLL
jgi:hypothetical protein